MALQRHDVELLQKTEEQHIEALERNRDHLENTISLQFKASSELLNQ